MPKKKPSVNLRRSLAMRQSWEKRRADSTKPAEPERPKIHTNGKTNGTAKRRLSFGEEMQVYSAIVDILGKLPDTSRKTISEHLRATFDRQEGQVG